MQPVRGDSVTTLSHRSARLRRFRRRKREAVLHLCRIRFLSMFRSKLVGLHRRTANRRIQPSAPL